MTPAVFNIDHYRGDTLRLRFAFFHDEAHALPIDLTGTSPAAQIRAKPDAADAIDLICFVDGTESHVLWVELDPDDTRLLPKKGVWDLAIGWPSGDVDTFVAGKVTVRPDVTKPAPPPPLERIEELVE